MIVTQDSGQKLAVLSRRDSPLFNPQQAKRLGEGCQPPTRSPKGCALNERRRGVSAHPFGLRERMVALTPHRFACTGLKKGTSLRDFIKGVSQCKKRNCEVVALNYAILECFSPKNNKTNKTSVARCFWGVGWEQEGRDSWK